jgi:cytochrome c553
MKRWLFRGALAALVLGVGGFLVAASGIIPIKASSGHWPITAWLLHFSMQRSIATYSAAIDPPALDEPRLVLQGAGHYETGCRPCHGSPAYRHPRIPQAMTPHPPYLPPLLADWEAEDLFYIVKHGVKFTGMPAWPTQRRDDEVWAMVAFLRKFPSLSAEEYQRLVHGEDGTSERVAALSGLLGPQSAPRAVTANCARCHGGDGLGRGLGAFPKLAGQRAAYVLASLTAYAHGHRHSGVMQPLAAGLSPEEMAEIAQYYSSLPKTAPARLSQTESRADKEPLFSPAPPEPDQPQASARPRTRAQSISRGQAIAHQGIPGQRVPICAHCHGPGAVRHNPIYPELAGQYGDYLVLQLELFKKRQRGGTAYAHIMYEVADTLTTEQMRDVALYYESLPTLGGKASRDTQR